MTGLTVFADLFVPDELISTGLHGNMGRTNDRVPNQGGFVTVTPVRYVTLRQYEFAVIAMALALWQQIVALHEITGYGAYGVLFRDPTDSTVDLGEGALVGYAQGVEAGVMGYGNGTPTYGLRQLAMVPGSSRFAARAVTRPDGPPAILRGGAAVIYGAAAGNAAQTTAPVYIAFVPDATANVSSVTPGASTIVVLSAALAGLVVTTGKLWLQGLTGADAALLNNMAHTITAIAGTTYTLSTNTAGKTITAAGQGHKYPQPTETLQWSGAFCVPVHFRDDTLNWQVVADGDEDSILIQGPSFYLDEVREE